MASEKDLINEFIEKAEKITSEIEKLYDRLVYRKVCELVYREEPLKDEEIEKVIEEIKELLDEFNKIAKQYFDENKDYYPLWLETLMKTSTHEEVFEDPYYPYFESPDDCFEKHKKFREFRKALNERIRELIKNRIRIPGHHADLVKFSFSKALEHTIKSLPYKD